jgi:hypothetical protein
MKLIDCWKGRNKKCRGEIPRINIMGINITKVSPILRGVEGLAWIPYEEYLESWFLSPLIIDG